MTSQLLTKALKNPEEFILGILDGSSATLKDVMNEAAKRNKPFILFRDMAGLADDSAEPVTWQELQKRLPYSDLPGTAILDGRQGNWEPRPVQAIKAELCRG